MKKTIFIILLLALTAGSTYYYLTQKQHIASAKENSIHQLAEQTIQTNQISTNLNSENLIQVKFSIEVDSKNTKKQAEKIIPILESDIIKILSQSNKAEFKDIRTKEKQIKDRLNQRFSEGEVVDVYITELLIQ